MVCGPSASHASGSSACSSALIMNKRILASALASVFLAPAAFAGGLGVSAGIATTNIHAGSASSVSVPEAVLGVSDQLGSVLVGGNFAQGHGQGVHVHQFSGFADLPVSVGRVVAVPYAELGYDRIGAFAVDHTAVGVMAQTNTAPVQVFGGMKVVRTFGVQGLAGAENGTYAGADLGLGFTAGPGAVQVADDFTRLPVSASTNTDVGRFSVGDAIAF